MTNRSETIRDRILGHPAPTDIEWPDFITMWNAYADRVEEESGDRLSVTMNGHRTVFRRGKDGLVGIEDIERARHLYADHPESHGTGNVFVVTVTEAGARLYDFDLSNNHVDQTHFVDNKDPRGHHMRTVERKRNRDDEKDLDRFFVDLVTQIDRDAAGRDFVIIGHGTGKADTAAHFAQFLQHRHSPLVQHVLGVGHIDLSAATPFEIEKKAQELAGL